MKFSDQLYLDGSHGYIGYSDRGIYLSNLYLLDHPVLRVDFHGSSAASATITFTDSNGNTLAEWDIDATIGTAYIEFGDVLAQQFQYPALTADTFSAPYMRVVMTAIAYNIGGVVMHTNTVNWSAWRKSKYDSYNAADTRLWASSLPSRYRMVYSPVEYDTMYNIIGMPKRSYNAAFHLYNGATPVGSGTPAPMTSANFIMKTKKVTSVVASGVGDSTALVVEPICKNGIVALKWFSRIGGCWKSVVLDKMTDQVGVTDTLPVVLGFDEGTLMGGDLSIRARFPNATFRDWCYYCDIVIGEKLTMCGVLPNYVGSYEDIPVTVTCNTQPLGEREIRDIEFTIRIKHYAIND